MKIIVGMSGGVDSSVTALLLKEAGHDVVGVTMSIWGKKDLKNTGTKDACYGPNEKEDIEEAKRICGLIDIPLHVLDCVETYEKIVLDNFKKEYLLGRTPNPCIWCNSQVKFGALPMLAEQSGVEFEKFATGHYARVEFDEEKQRYILKSALDPKKDQTYFLYRLTQTQLSRSLFPLGTFVKDEVKKIAVENKLHTLDKEESQDFYSGDYNELLEVDDKQGNIVDRDGTILGKHNGIWNYTLGQRKGLGIAACQPLYVIELNKDKNEVVVGFESETYSKSLVASDLNWIAFEDITEDLEITAKIRSSQQPKKAILKKHSETEVYVEFEEEQKAITPGQSIVFYQDDIVLGGGIIN